MEDPVLKKLSFVLGPEEAPKFITSTCRALGIKGLHGPQDRMLFACSLIQRGGLLEAIGRAIKIQAILHGAREP
jgi:hypothetical protein